MEYSFTSADNQIKGNLAFIDALRAIAILMVILHHVGELFPDANIIRLISPYCQYGVQLFFVMSAFTMCYTSTHMQPTLVDARSFYLKRIFRIAPLYILAIPFYYALTIIAFNINAFSFSQPENYNWINILSNVFFLHGFLPSANNTIVPGGWSIGCEMIFYAIFPLLIILCRKSLWYLIMVQILALIAVAGLLYTATLFGHKGLGGGSSFAYYFIANQMAPFIIGITLFFLWNNHTYFKIIAVSSVFSVFILVFWSNQYAWILSPLLSGIISSLLAKLISKFTFNNFFYSIGKMSYSMYLLHFLFIWIVALLLTKSHPAIEDNLLALIAFGIVAFFSFAFSKITYNYIEMYMVSNGKDLIKKITERDFNRKING